MSTPIRASVWSALALIVTVAWVAAPTPTDNRPLPETLVPESTPQAPELSDILLDSTTAMAILTLFATDATQCGHVPESTMYPVLHPLFQAALRCPHRVDGVRDRLRHLYWCCLTQGLQPREKEVAEGAALRSPIAFLHDLAVQSPIWAQEPDHVTVVLDALLGRTTPDSVERHKSDLRTVIEGLDVRNSGYGELLWFSLAPILDDRPPQSHWVTVADAIVTDLLSIHWLRKADDCGGGVVDGVVLPSRSQALESFAQKLNVLRTISKWTSDTSLVSLIAHCLRMEEDVTLDDAAQCIDDALSPDKLPWTALAICEQMAPFPQIQAVLMTVKSESGDESVQVAVPKLPRHVAEVYGELGVQLRGLHLPLGQYLEEMQWAAEDVPAAQSPTTSFSVPDVVARSTSYQDLIDRSQKELSSPSAIGASPTSQVRQALSSSGTPSPSSTVSRVRSQGSIDMMQDYSI